MGVSREIIVHALTASPHIGEKYAMEYLEKMIQVSYELPMRNLVIKLPDNLEIIDTLIFESTAVWQKQIGTLKLEKMSLSTAHLFRSYRDMVTV